MVGQNKKRKNNITNIPTRIQAQTKLKLKLAQHLTQKLFCFTIPIINEPLFQLVINCSTWCRPKYLQILLYESLDIAPNILHTQKYGTAFICAKLQFPQWTNWTSMMYTIQYEMLYLRALKSWRKGQLNLVHSTKNKRNKEKVMYAL